MTALLIGCGGGGGGNTNTLDSASSSSVAASNENPLTSKSFTIDESAFADTSAFSEINATARDTAITLEPKNQNNALNISSSDLIQNSAKVDYATYSYATSLASNAINTHVGSPLYIDGKFAGMIDSYDNGKIVVRDADDISDVYSAFDIAGSVDTVERQVRSAIRASFGKYDTLNKKPLKISIVRKKVPSKTRSVQYEPVAVIEFPKGYTIPITRTLSANVDCELSEAMCDATFNYDKKWEKDFGKTKQFGSVTFTTAGSKIEIGLGAYIRAMYNYETVGDNQYYFEFKPSAYYRVNMHMSIKGSNISGDDETFKILKNGLNINIPLHEFVSLNLNIIPEIVVGMEDAPNNKKINFEASLQSQRTGYVKLTYTNGGGDVSKGIKEESEPLGKAGVTLKLDTGGDKVIAYLFPEIALRPQLKFTKISKKINIAYVRNGARIDTKIKGKVDDDWIVQNAKVTGSAVQDVYLKTYLYGLIDYKWDIKVGDTDLYESDDWSKIYKSNTFKLLEWMSQFLQKPLINVRLSKGKRFVNFDIQSVYKDKIRFYYTLDDKDIDDIEGINKHPDNTPYQVWHSGDNDIVLNEDKAIKVRAVVFTKDVSDAPWSWGMSISKQAEGAAVYLPEPKLNPASKDFKASQKIALTQSENDEIRVSRDGGLTYNSCGRGSCSITLSDSTDLSAMAVREFKGKEYNSTVALGYYRKCDSNEAVGSAGKCVTQCPYLWDITYSESGEWYNKGQGEAIETITNGTTKFYNVPIVPVACDDALDITTFEREVCEPYIKSGNLEPNSHHGECHAPSGGESTGFGHTAYLSGTLIHMFDFSTCSDDTVDLSLRVDDGCPYGGGVEVNVHDDFESKIIKRQSFSISVDGEGGTFTFTPRGYQKQSSSSSSSYGSSEGSSSSSASSIDNESDNDIDNGGNVDGSYNDEGAPKTWYLKYSANSAAFGSGTMTVKNFTYKCEGYTTELYGKSCTTVDTDTPNTSITYSGSLAHDSLLTPLNIFENGLQISAYYPDFQWKGNVDLNQASGTTDIGNIGGCWGVWKDSYTQNLESATAFTISIDGSNGSCSLEFKPCTKALCQ